MVFRNSFVCVRVCGWLKLHLSSHKFSCWPRIESSQNGPCVPLSFPTVSIKIEQIGERKTRSQRGLHLPPSVLSHTFISSSVNVSYSHCGYVHLDAFRDGFFFFSPMLFYSALCVYVCVCVCACACGCDYAEVAGANQWLCVSNYSGTEPIDQRLHSNFFTTDV